MEDSEHREVDYDPGYGEPALRAPGAGTLIWAKVAQTVIMLVAIAAAWLSLSTKNDNLSKAFESAQSANHDLLSQNTELTEQVKTLAEQDTEMAKQVKGLVEEMKTSVDQSNGLVDQIKGIAEQVKTTGDQTKTTGDQTNEIAKDVVKILNEHTQSFVDARKASLAAKNAAQSSEVATKRAIRDLRPKPSWWQRLTQPSPTPYARRK